MKKTFEFTDEQRHELIEIFVHGTIQELLSRIEQIVSERITPEQDTIKPYHEHGNSVASDRTESGQSAEDVLKGMYGNNTQYGYSFNSTIEAMRLHAAQVCADKEREIEHMAAVIERWKNSNAHWCGKHDELKSELDRLNESLTVMVRKNAELESDNVNLDMHYRYMVEAYHKVKPPDDMTAKELWDDYTSKMNRK